MAFPDDVTEHPHITDVRRNLRASFERTVQSALAEAGRDAAEPEFKFLVDLLAKRTKPLHLVALSGYIGGGDDDDWFRLYDDETLNTFWIIRWVDVAGWDRRTDDDAACGKIDVVLLSREAQIARGRRQPRPNPGEARYIDGSFLTVGDAVGSPVGYRPRGAGALFSDVGSPGCCRRPSSSFP